MTTPMREIAAVLGNVAGLDAETIRAMERGNVSSVAYNVDEETVSLTVSVRLATAPEAGFMGRAWIVGRWLLATHDQWRLVPKVEMRGLGKLNIVWLCFQGIRA